MTYITAIYIAFIELNSLVEEHSGTVANKNRPNGSFDKRIKIQLLLLGRKVDVDRIHDFDLE